jgi:hypothetical protein
VALIVAYLVSHPAARLPQGAPTLDIFLFAFGVFITALLMFHVVTPEIVDNLLPVKKLSLTATFDGILNSAEGHPRKRPFR